MGVDPATLILYGRSLGSGPAIHLATKYPQGAAGLVLESALLSIVRTQCGCCVVDEKSWETDLFCNIDKCEMPFLWGVCIMRSMRRLHTKTVRTPYAYG